MGSPEMGSVKGNPSIWPHPGDVIPLNDELK